MMSAKKFFLLHCAPLLVYVKNFFHVSLSISFFIFWILLFLFLFFQKQNRCECEGEWNCRWWCWLTNKQHIFSYVCLALPHIHSRVFLSLTHSQHCVVLNFIFLFFSPRKEGRFWRNFMLLTKKNSVSHSLAAGIDFGRIIANEHSN